MESEELVEIEFNTEAFNKVEGICKVKITMESGITRYCKKLTRNRNEDTKKQYPYSILVATEFKTSTGAMVWKKYSISDNGEVYSTAKDEPDYQWPEDHGKASLLLTKEGILKYLDTL